MPTRPQPSDLELQVLGLLWAHGPLTARRANELMPDGKTRSYTTVLSVLQVMEKKGLVTHRPEGRAHVYSPTVTRKQVLRPLLRGLVSKVFNGDPSVAVQHLIRETATKPDDLKQIRAVLDELEREA